MPEKRTCRQVLRDAAALLLKDLRDVKWVIILIIAYFAFLQYFVGQTCPVVLITGYPCPACGLTRAGLLVLRLKFAEAFFLQPFIYPLMSLAVILCINRYVLLKKNTEALKWCAAAVIALMVLYYMYRMYRCFPGNPPVTWHKNNLLSWLFGCIS